jgi:hypothetical protein
MDNWNCPVDELDPGIKEIVQTFYDNGMRPFMSCSGTKLDHDVRRGYIPISASIEFVDSDLSRRLFSRLIDDDRFECSITMSQKDVVYDNHIPDGLKFKIEFANPYGRQAKDLLQITRDTISNSQENSENRGRINLVCTELLKLNTEDGSRMMFEFNNPNLLPNQTEPNYALEVINGWPHKNLALLQSRTKCPDEEFEVNNDNQITIYSSDFLVATARLKKVMIDYMSLKRGKFGALQRSKRHNKFIDIFENEQDDGEIEWN